MGVERDWTCLLQDLLSSVTLDRVSAVCVCMAPSVSLLGPVLLPCGGCSVEEEKPCLGMPLMLAAGALLLVVLTAVGALVAWIFPWPSWLPERLVQCLPAH